MINLLSGGKHAGGRVDFQDFLIIPTEAKTADEVTMIAYRVWYACRSILQAEGRYTQLVADEGGLGPELESNEAMMQLAIRAIEGAGYVAGGEVSLAIDVAASHFHHEGRYDLANENRQLNPDEMIDRLAAWVKDYPLISIEDGLDENDWSGWRTLTQRLGTVQLLGDDLFTTDPERLRRGIDQGVANSILIKPNQIGTITETLGAICLAQASGYRCVVSTRSGETEDAWIVDLAVGTGAGQLKPGSITRSERLAKFNRLRRIAAEAPELTMAHPFGRDSA
jgi:enolase